VLPERAESRGRGTGTFLNALTGLWQRPGIS